MSFDRELEDMFTVTVSYASYVSMNVHGAETFSTATKTILARIEQGNRLVRDSAGREVVSATRLFLRPTAQDGTTYIPTIKDQITLPAGYAPLTPPIIQVLRHNDETSGGLPHHWEVSV